MIIAGPTAIGKTAVAVKVAQKLSAEIISADSRQCYRELCIGVARPNADELARVPHHFIATHRVSQKINAAYYEIYVMQLLAELFEKNDTVILTGGTGLYIKAITTGLDIIPDVPAPIRNMIIKNYKANGINWLREQLREKDALYVAQGEMHNPQRMMRALEVAEATGRSIFSFRNSEKTQRDFNIVQVGLEMDRSALNNRINQRVDAMIVGGLEAEAKTLLSYRHLNALQTVGYKEMFDYLDGNISVHQAITLIKQNTRRYAKRQMTWFKKQPQFIWVTVYPESTAESTATTILGILYKNGTIM